MSLEITIESYDGGGGYRFSLFVVNHIRDLESTRFGTWFATRRRCALPRHARFPFRVVRQRRKSEEKLDAALFDLS